MERQKLEEAKEFLNSLNRAYDNELINEALECIDRVQELEREFQKVKVMLGGAIEKAEELKKENVELRKQLEDAKRLKRVKTVRKYNGKEYIHDGVLDEGKQLLFLGYCQKRIAKAMNIEWREENG